MDTSISLLSSLSGINADSEIASLFIATEQLAAEMQQFIAQFDKELALYEKSNALALIIRDMALTLSKSFFLEVILTTLSLNQKVCC